MSLPPPTARPSLTPPWIATAPCTSSSTTSASPAPGTPTDVEEAVWDNVLDVNLKSMMLTTKYAAPKMIDAGGGSIINMSLHRRRPRRQRPRQHPPTPPPSPASSACPRDHGRPPRPRQHPASNVIAPRPTSTPPWSPAPCPTRPRENRRKAGPLGRRGQRLGHRLRRPLPSPATKPAGSPASSSPSMPASSLPPTPSPCTTASATNNRRLCQPSANPRPRTPRGAVTLNRTYAVETVIPTKALLHRQSGPSFRRKPESSNRNR